jgi:hypothetical protein
MLNSLSMFTRFYCNKLSNCCDGFNVVWMVKRTLLILFSKVICFYCVLSCWAKLEFFVCVEIEMAKSESHHRRATSPISLSNISVAELFLSYRPK